MSITSKKQKWQLCNIESGSITMPKVQNSPIAEN